MELLELEIVDCAKFIIFSEYSSVDFFRYRVWNIGRVSSIIITACCDRLPAKTLLWITRVNVNPKYKPRSPIPLEIPILEASISLLTKPLSVWQLLLSRRRHSQLFGSSPPYVLQLPATQTIILISHFSYATLLKHGNYLGLKRTPWSSSQTVFWFSCSCASNQIIVIICLKRAPWSVFSKQTLSIVGIFAFIKLTKAINLKANKRSLPEDG